MDQRSSLCHGVSSAIACILLRNAALFVSLYYLLLLPDLHDCMPGNFLAYVSGPVPDRVANFHHLPGVLGHYVCSAK